MYFKTKRLLILLTTLLYLLNFNVYANTGEEIIQNNSSWQQSINTQIFSWNFTTWMSNSWTLLPVFLSWNQLDTFADNQWLSGNVWQSGHVLDRQLPPNNEQISTNNPSQNTWNLLPDLLITEIFFDWTDEFIEIYNAGNAFSGSITISGAKSSTIEIQNIVLNSDEILIIWDAGSFILENHNYILNKWLSISDTQPINIEIIVSWTIIDNFYIDQSLVSDTNNKKTSFSKYIDTNNTFISQIEQNFNIQDWYIWNPWKVFEESFIPPQPTKPDLKITEIFAQWNKSWIEITNISNKHFSWNLQLTNILSGSYLLTWIEISANQSKVFSNPQSMSLFQNIDQIQELVSTFNITDQQEINIDLIRSWTVLDNFFVHNSRVEYSKDSNSSFEKILSWWVRYTSFVWLNIDRFYNITRWYSANPNKYFQSAENIVDVTTAKTTNPNNTWNTQIPIDCDDWRDDTTLSISEIFMGNSAYESFVEFDILDDILDSYEYLYLTWTLLESDLRIDLLDSNLDIERNKKIMLSNTEFWYWEWMDSLNNTDFSLTNSWFLTVYWYDSYSDSMEILDSIQITTYEQWYSNYYNATNNQCIKKLDQIQKFSPWFDKKFLEYFEIDIEPKIIYQYSSSGWWSCYSSKTFNLDKTTNKEITISTMRKYKRDDWNYVFLLKLQNKTSADISIRDHKIQVLQWDEVFSINSNTLFANSSMIFVLDSEIPEKNNCINITNWSKLVDRYCYRTISTANEKDISNIQNDLKYRVDEQIDTQIEIENDKNIQLQNPTDVQTPIPSLKWTLEIKYIDYNPDGSDTNNEVVEIKSNLQEKLDLRDLKIQYFKDGKSYSAKYLVSKADEDFIYPNQTLPIKWTYSLPNSSASGDVIVNLLYQDEIVANYSYNPSPTIPWEYLVKTVYDGDTFSIDFNGQTQKVRLLWIDAPESTNTRFWYIECFGKEAKNYLKDLIDDKKIYIYFDELWAKKDTYWRWLAYADFQWSNINELLISNGFAFEYTHNNQSYTKQNNFKNYQNLASQNKVWLRTTNTCDWSRTFGIEENQLKQDAEKQDYFDVEIKIKNIDFAPTTGQESITIELLNSDFINLNNDFYLLRDTTKRNLEYWIITKWEPKTLYWNFTFPNTKASCIKLIREDQVFDTYCYDPKSNSEISPDIENEENTMSNEKEILQTQTSNIDLEIKSILPNPIWADKDKEEITILFQWDFVWKSRPYLLIWENKKYLEQSDFIQNWENTITKNFSFPNSPTCLQIVFEDFISDKFCYPSPQEWIKYSISDGILETISTLDFTILKNSKLTQIDNKTCLTYQGITFNCKTAPYSNLSKQKEIEVELNKDFISFFNDELRNNRWWLYYNTDFKKQFDLYFELKSKIKNGELYSSLWGAVLENTEYQKIYSQKYPSSISQLLETKLNNNLPEQIKTKIKALQTSYFQELNSFAINW